MSASVQPARVWDPLIRVFHWSLAACVLLNYLATEEGGDLHQWIGYIAVGLVCIRIVWGFVGPTTARFSSFFPTPARLTQHWADLKAGRHDRHEGHNPAGGAMILLMLTLVIGLGISGYLLEEVDAFFGEEWLEEIHELLANLLIASVVIHVAAVVLIQRLTGTSLVKPMITGRRD